MFVSCNFYPRPPRGGRRLGAIWMMLSLVISTHALREEGDVEGLMLSPDCEISTHALREEGDRGQSRWLYPLVQFLPTPSARRATLKRRLAAVPKVISTHALREEGDQLAPQQRRVESQISTHALREEGDGQRQHNGGQGYDFYPRPPRGGRHPYYGQH